MKHTALFSSLTYEEPPSKKEAQDELNREKEKRRKMREVSVEAWLIYKEETKERIEYLMNILRK